MSALTEFLPDSLGRFMDVHPQIRVEVEEQLSGDIVRALLDGVADVGVFAEGTPSDGISVETFQTDQLVVVCSREHPLAKRKRLAFVDCLEHSFKSKRHKTPSRAKHTRPPAGSAGSRAAA